MRGAMTSPSSPEVSGLIERLKVAVSRAQDKQLALQKAWGISFDASTLPPDDPRARAFHAAVANLHNALPSLWIAFAEAASALSAYEARLGQTEFICGIALACADRVIKPADMAWARTTAEDVMGRKLKAAQDALSTYEGRLEEARKFFDRDFGIDGPNVIIEFKDHAEAIRYVIATRAALEQSGEGLGASRANSGGTAQEPKSENKEGH